MELLAGGSLAARMADRAGDPGGRDPADIAPLLSALCRAVTAVHAAEIVHRDLKPANILFRTDGSVALIDFGLARWPDQAPGEDGEDGERGVSLGVTRPGEWVGTQRYMAPEQWRGGTDIDRRTDIYALGVIAFELVTGRAPFVGSAAEIRHGHSSRRCPRPSAFQRNAAPVDDVLLRCLAKDRSQRFDSAAEFAAAFHAALAAKPVRPPSRSAVAAARPARPGSGPGPRTRPVALIGLPSRVPAPRVVAALAAHNAVLAAITGDGYIAALPWEPNPSSAVRLALDTAHSVADELAIDGAIAVHLAPLRVRLRGARLRLLGAALNDAARWLAPSDARGVWLTRAAAAVLARDELAPAGDRDDTETRSAWLRPSRHGRLATANDFQPERIPLRGRDELSAVLLAALRDSMSRKAPLLATVESATGLGKTRLLHALASAVREGDAARVEYLQVRAHGHANPLDALLRLALQLPDGDLDPSEFARAWSAVAGDAPDPCRSAAALTLGVISRDAPHLAALVAAPGGFRQAAARAVAAALTGAAAQRPLVLLIDDGHLADQSALDAIEMATMDSDDGAARGVALAVCVAAGPALFALRPRWGGRAARTQRVRLEPLERDHSRAMLGDLLRPVACLPETVVDELHARARGVPWYLVELARLIHASGAIRRSSERSGYYLAADEIARATEAPIDEELARRTLAGLSTPLVPLVRVCAALGSGFSEAELHDISAHLASASHDIDASSDNSADATSEGDGDGDASLDVDIDGDIDIGIGLQQLARRGLVVRRAEGYAMRHPLLAHAIDKRTPPRVRQRIHAAAVACLRDAPHAEPQRILHHAKRCGASELVPALALRLARQAHDHHRYVEAEQHYTTALDYLDDGDGRVLPALAGRGSARYRLQRLEHALDDLRRARARAERLGDREMLAHLLLEEATVLDWCHQWDASAELAERAAAAAESLAAPQLLARAALARGRSLARREQHAASVPYLQRAAQHARASGDHELGVMSMLMLGPGLLFTGRIDDARQCFAEVIERCRQAGDDFHLAVGYLNRQLLWLEVHDIESMLADLERSAALGRRLGNAQFERAATLNLAEALYWHGAVEKACALARRALALQERFPGEQLTPDDRLLLVRIHCQRGEAEQARSCLRWIDEHGDSERLPPSMRILIALARLALAAVESRPAPRATWLALEAEAASQTVYEERTEILMLAAELHARCGDLAEARYWAERVRQHASPLWARRIAALSRALPA